MLKTVKDKDDFLSLVQAVRSLSEHNRKKIDETTDHLTKYGYKKKEMQIELEPVIISETPERRPGSTH